MFCSDKKSQLIQQRETQLTLDSRACLSGLKISYGRQEMSHLLVERGDILGAVAHVHLAMLWLSMRSWNESRDACFEEGLNESYAEEVTQRKQAK